jgi:hypothetical protein
MFSPKLSNLFIFITTFILLILFGELILRIFFFDEYSLHYENILHNFSDSSIGPIFIYNDSSDIKYYLKPNSSAENYYYINSFGFRDNQYTKEKPQNTSRIIFLGDSVVFGSHSKINQTFVKILEKRLNTYYGQKIEVWNAGLAGYNTVQEEILLKERILQFNPDIVLLGFIMNDFGSFPVQIEKKDNSTFIVKYENLDGFPLVTEKVPEISLFLVRESYFFRFLNIRLSNILKKSYKSNRLATLNSIIRMHTLLKKEDRQFIVIIFPTVKNYSHYEDLETHQWLAEKLNESEIRYYDLYNDIKGYNYLNFKTDKEDIYHYNEYGNKVIAGLLFNYFLNESVIAKD